MNCRVRPSNSDPPAQWVCSLSTARPPAVRLATSGQSSSQNPRLCALSHVTSSTARPVHARSSWRLHLLRAWPMDAIRDGRETSVRRALSRIRPCRSTTCIAWKRHDWSAASDSEGDKDRDRGDYDIVGKARGVCSSRRTKATSSRSQIQHCSKSQLESERTVGHFSPVRPTKPCNTTEGR